VRRIQEQLNQLGAEPRLSEDADFGARTETAVRRFQGAHRLTPDGVVGVATAAMLRHEHAFHGRADRTGPCHTPEDPGPDSVYESGRGGADPVVAAPGAAVGDQTKPERVMVRLHLETDASKKAADEAEAAAFGGAQEVALSIAALDAVLARHPNISELGLLSHGTPQGKIFIGGREVSLSELAAQLKPRAAGLIQKMIFLGCSIGNDRAGLAAIKKRLGATSAEGVSGNVKTLGTKPVPDGNGKPLTSEAAIRKAGQTDPAEAIRANARAQLGGALRTACILGFKGRQIESIPDKDLLRIYDEQKGVFVAKMTSPGEVCYEDLTYDKPDEISGVQRVLE
jgi:hypothetical protein